MKTAKIILSLILSMIFSTVIAFTAGVPAAAPFLFVGGLILSYTVVPGEAAYLICGSITAGNAPDCDYPLVGGVNEIMTLMNFNDITSYTENATTKVIEAITMSGATVGFAFQGQLLSHECKYTLVPKNYNNMYKHEIKFLCFNVSPAAKLNLEKMAKGRIVAAVQNNYHNATGDSVFEVYGKECGLYVSAMERVLNDPDNQGAIVVTLSSHEKSLEGRMPVSIFITDYTTTKAVYDGLLT